MTGPANHALLAPSGAHQWAPDGACRGAVHMQRRYPEDVESERAREGTAAHWYVSETLSGRIVEVGAEAPNGVPVDAEMIDCGALLISYVRQCIPASLLLVEKRVAITSVHPTDCWGTMDVGAIDFGLREVHVVDYKYGHRYVDAYRNWQLILYAIGLLDEHRVPQSDWKHWSVNTSIVQPRNYHPSGPVRPAPTLGGTALLNHAEQLHRAALEAVNPGSRLVTGAHCRDCTARHACPALLQAAALSVDIAHEQTPMDLTPAALGLELRYLRAAEARIKARADALEEQALGLVRGGQDVPLWKGDYSSGRERWKMPATQVALLGDMWGAELRKPVECVTPVQARKAGIDDAVVAAYAERPRGSLRLVAVSDDTVSRAFEGGGQ